MNCPYCNKLASKYVLAANIYDYICYACPGEPIFSDWEDARSFQRPHHQLITTYHVRDKNQDDDYLGFNPLSMTLHIDSLRREFKLDCIVTPSNVYEIYERITKLKSFL